MGQVRFAAGSGPWGQVPRGELVVHGWDLARAMHRRWPVTRQQVSLIWTGAEPILPGWVAPAHAAGHSAAYAVHLGDGLPRMLCFTDGQVATALPAGRKVDCHIGGSPVAIRRAQTRPLAQAQRAVQLA